MRRNRSAKIIATLGPATTSESVIADLCEAGVDVFRLNFSHGTKKDHERRYRAIRRMERRFGRPFGILMDLQGPKLRLGTFADGRVRLHAGAPFRLHLEDRPGDEHNAPLPHPEIFAALEPGMDLLLDDGKVRLRVTECGAGYAQTSVINGGVLSDHKGVNVPSAVVDVSPLTEKDRGDLQFGLELGVDWVALSFVQRPEDVAEARKLVAGRAGVLAKLEKPSAIERLTEIVDLSDAVMVARGDLGVELPPEDVPSIQKRIVHTCRQAGKPVVIATQMLDSMVYAPTPTRAEASDVATAIYDGADAVMLSAETAVGEYPLEAVGIMNRIIERVEFDPQYRIIMAGDRRRPEATSEDAVSAAARQVAETLSAAAVGAFTWTGATALRAARERPHVPILGLTPNKETARRLALVWGVHPIRTQQPTTFGRMIRESLRLAKEQGFAKVGQRMVLIAGVPLGTPGATNILRIAWVE
ncbi:MAG: pyruvate kinase [Hyphomicrobiales bacterium]|nr:pyruvate kinase [Hyphomicrobiales bacterium]